MIHNLRTQISDPPAFEAPVIETSMSNDNKVIISLKKASGINGPILKYYLFLLPEKHYESKNSEDFSDSEVRILCFSVNYKPGQVNVQEKRKYKIKRRINEDFQVFISFIFLASSHFEISRKCIQAISQIFCGGHLLAPAEAFCVCARRRIFSQLKHLP